MKIKKTLALILSLVTVFSAAFTSMADVAVVEEIEQAEQVEVPEEIVAITSDLFNEAAVIDTEIVVEEVTDTVSNNLINVDRTDLSEENLLSTNEAYSPTTWQDLVIEINAGKNNFLLTKNLISMGEYIPIPEGRTITIDLNGYTLDRGLKEKEAVSTGYVIKVSKGATLTIQDNSDAKTGMITGGNTSVSGGGVSVNGGTFILEGGSITNNTANSYGGGVHVSSGGTFTMKGGSITKNTANERGGGVNVTNSSFTMEGGYITGNTSNDLGGGVYIQDNGTFIMSGGEITGNTAKTNGGGICNWGKMTVDGTAEINGNVVGGVIEGETLSGGTTNNVYLINYKYITIGEGCSSTAKVGVTTETPPAEGTPVKITENGNEANVSLFTSDNSDYIVAYNAGEYLQLQVPAKKTIADILALSATTFPASQDTGWLMEKGEGTAYLSNGALWFDSVNDWQKLEIATTGKGVLNDAGYRYSESGTTIDFELEDNKLVKITVNCTGDLARVNGIYKPAYKVSYDGNGATTGTTWPDTRFASGKTVTVREKPYSLNKTGYDFNGWNTQADGKGTHYDEGAQFTITEDTTLYAEWIAPVFTVTFDTQGGSNVPYQMIRKDQKVTKPADPTKMDCEFAGWYTETEFAKEAGTAYNFETPVTADFTLYAKWSTAPAPTPAITITSNKTEYKVGETIDLSITTTGIDLSKNMIYITDGVITMAPPIDSTGKGGYHISAKNVGTYTYKAYVKDNPDIKGQVTVTVKGNNPDPKPDPSPSEEHEPLYTGTWNAPVKSGSWSQDSHGIWHYTSSESFRNTWGYIVNPFAKEGQNQADWFWFDIHGNMLTGWQFINGKWYYLNPTMDGTLGACQLGGVTPDGWTVDESGAWIESIPRK